MTYVTTDSQGNFTTPLVLPRKYQPGKNYAIYAVAVSGIDHAHVPFTFTTPIMDMNGIYVVFGEQLYLEALGYAVGEKVNLYWNYGQIGQLLVQTFTADKQGSVKGSFTVPSNPNLGTVMIGTVGVHSGLIATGSVHEDGGMILTPTFVNPGDTEQVQVGGLGSVENARVILKGTIVASGTTDSSGLLSTSFVVPPSSQYGSVQLVAKGSSSGVKIYGQIYYNEILTIDPTSGPAGTVVTLNGSQYVPFSVLDVVLDNVYCGCPGVYGNVTVGADGTFTTTFTMLSGLVSGTQYPIWAGDPSPYPPDGIALFTYQ